MALKGFLKVLNKSCSNPAVLSLFLRTPLHAAAFAEDVAGLQLVLRHGAEINAVDNSGRSALMVAADKGHSGTVGTYETLAEVIRHWFNIYFLLSKYYKVI